MEHIEFYFNENEANDFISNHSIEEIKQEIIDKTDISKILLKNFGILDDALELVNEYYVNSREFKDDSAYYQTKCIFANKFVEYRKYIEFLENYIKKFNNE